MIFLLFFFFSSRRRHTRWNCDWSSDVCSSDLPGGGGRRPGHPVRGHPRRAGMPAGTRAGDQGGGPARRGHAPGAGGTGPRAARAGRHRAVTRIVVLHYPAERARNWALLRAAARRRGLRLVTWAPHLLGLWCADGRQSACYAGKPARPGIVIHRTVAPFRGITVPALACLAAQGSLVLNPADAAFRSRDKLLTTVDLVAAGIPVVPTAAFDEPAGADLAALGPGELIVKPARGVRGQGIATHRSAAALTAAWRRRAEWRPGEPRPGTAGYHAEREHYLAQ